MADEDLEAGGAEPVAQPIALGLQRRRDFEVERVRQHEPECDGRLERPRADVGEELLGRARCGDEN